MSCLLGSYYLSGALSTLTLTTHQAHYAQFADEDMEIAMWGQEFRTRSCSVWIVGSGSHLLGVV